MKVGKTLYVSDRKSWRRWLSKHSRTAPEIWLVYYRKDSGKKRIPYNDAVEEALCFGWIDSLTKPKNAESWVQRFTPRRKGSPLSEMNKERIRRLMKSGKMTPAGLRSIEHHLVLRPNRRPALKGFTLPSDILTALKEDPKVWKNFTHFPDRYKRIRVAWIDGARKRPEEFDRRLRYLIRMTAGNKRFGMVQ